MYNIYIYMFFFCGRFVLLVLGVILVFLVLSYWVSRQRFPFGIFVVSPYVFVFFFFSDVFSVGIR